MLFLWVDYIFGDYAPHFFILFFIVVAIIAVVAYALKKKEETDLKDK